MNRIRGPYVRFCERDEAVTPHPTRCVGYGHRTMTPMCIERNVTHKRPFVQLVQPDLQGEPAGMLFIPSKRIMP